MSVMNLDDKVDADEHRASSWRQRARIRGKRLIGALVEFFAPRLSERLPPPPAERARRGMQLRTGDEHGEVLLFSILRASVDYQSAAIVVAREALAARRGGDDAYADFSVRFVLSRLPADKEGKIPIERLRDVLPHMSYTGALVPALLRLEEEGTVFLGLEANDDPMAEILRSHITHVELRRPL